MGILTETDSFSANVDVPDPGEQVTAESVEIPFQSVTNRTKNLNDHGFWDSVKKAAGNLLTYYIGSGGNLRALSGGKIQIAQGAFIESLATSGAQLIGEWIRSGIWTRSGTNGREVLRTSTQGNGDSTLDVGHDVFFLPTITANRVRTVSRTTGTVPRGGEKIRVVRTRPDGVVGSFTETIVSESGQTLFIFGNGYMGYVELTYSTTGGGTGTADWVPTGWRSVDGSSLTGTGLYGN